MWAGAGSFNPLMPPHAFPHFPPNVPQMSNAASGHQIPMLTDQNPIQVDQPLPKIPPTPADCLPQTGGVDWALIASCSPEELAETNDVDTLSAIFRSFVHAEFTQTEAQLMPNPLTAKFFRILQIGIQYLLDCQEQLKESVEDSEKTISALKTKMKALTAALVRAKDASKRNERISEVTEKCVVCGRRFKNISYLDGHVQRRHGALMPAWRSLRTGQLQGMEDFVEQIENLRQEVAKTHRELEKKYEKHPVSRIVSHTDESVKLMNELIKKQDEMMEQAKELEAKQLNFRKEMRNQLDDAVMALQEAQKKLDVQSIRISQIPAMPPPSTEPFRKDELSESLTEQIMKPSLNKQKVAFDLDHLINDMPPPPFELQAQAKPNLDIFDESKLIQPSTSDTTTGTPSKVTTITTGTPSKVTTITTGTPSKVTTITPAEKPTAIPGPSIRLDESETTTTTTPTPGEESGTTTSSPRDEEHKKIVSEIGGPATPPTKPKPPERVLPRSEQIIRLIQRARQLAEHEIDPNESPNRDAALHTITDGVLKRVDIKLAQLKRMRTYAPLSPIFVEKKMDQGTREYKITYNKLKDFVGSEVPFISDEFNKGLFKERKTRFPLLPAISKLTKGKESPKDKKKGKEGEGKPRPEKIPKIPETALHAAGKKMPYRHRMSRQRPRLLPGDSDVDIVSSFSNDSSTASIGYLEDPNFYKRALNEQMSALHGEEIHITSTSDELKPLDPKDMKEIDMNEFATSSSSDDSSDTSSGESSDSSSASFFDTNGKTKQLTLKKANKTKVFKLQDDGSDDFDVTQKVTTKHSDSDDELFDLSGVSSGDTISSSNELTKKVKDANLTELSDESDDM